MESLGFLVTLGTVWFAVFLLAVLVVGIFSAETNSFFIGTMTFVVGLSGMDLLFNVPVWETISSNWLSLLLFVVFYIVIGSVYAGFWRWVRFIKKHSYEINESYLRWSKTANKNGEPDDFESYLESDMYAYKAYDHKDKLASWMLMWPFGLFWDLMHRPARWIFNVAYNNLGTLFDSISKRTARNSRKK